MSTPIPQDPTQPRTLRFRSRHALEEWKLRWADKAPTDREGRWCQLSCNPRRETFHASRNGYNPPRSRGEDVRGQDYRIDQVVDHYLDTDEGGGRFWGTGDKIRAYIDGEKQTIARLVVGEDPESGTEETGFEENPLHGLAESMDFEAEEGTEPRTERSEPSPMVDEEFTGRCPNPKCGRWVDWDGESCDWCGASR